MKNSRALSDLICTARALILSTAALWMMLTISATQAHELQPAVANLTISDASVNGTLELSLEPLIAGMDLEALEDTDDAPEANAYDALRELSPADLQARFDAAWPDLKSKFRLLAGTSVLDINIDKITIPDIGDIELTRIATLTLSAALPADGTDVTFGWSADLGGLIVRQNLADGELGYAALLASGADSAPMPREGAANVGWMDNFINYVISGFEHIIPKGLDHILFVLGLFFFSLKIRPLILQVSAFTLAHTVTLAMATTGLVTISPSIVEPLIALSIAFVAFENIRGGEITLRRTAIVFAFGLLHGLGFASVLGDVGLEPSKFISSLIAFNIGVELGQLAVIAVAYILLAIPFGKQSWYRKFFAIPASVVIGLIGIYWTIERIFF